MLLIGETKLRILSLIVVDAAVILLSTSLVICGLIPLYPLAAIIYPLLFAFNVFSIWKHNRQQVMTVKPERPVSIVLWVIVIVFTLAGIAAIVAYVKGPSAPLAVQAGVAVAVVGYLWFMILHLRQSQQDRPRK